MDWHLTDNWYAPDLPILTNLPHIATVAKECAQVFVCWGKTKSGVPTHTMVRG